MPYSSNANNAKINVAQETNVDIDAAHLEFMHTYKLKISKRDYVAALVKVALNHRSDVQKAIFPPGEKIPA